MAPRRWCPAVSIPGDIPTVKRILRLKETDRYLCCARPVIFIFRTISAGIGADLYRRIECGMYSSLSTQHGGLLPVSESTIGYRWRNHCFNRQTSKSIVFWAYNRGGGKAIILAFNVTDYGATGHSGRPTCHSDDRWLCGLPGAYMTSTLHLRSFSIYS